MCDSDLMAMKYYSAKERYEQTQGSTDNPISRIFELHKPFFTFEIGTKKDETGYTACSHCCTCENGGSWEPTEFPCETIEIIMSYLVEWPKNVP